MADTYEPSPFHFQIVQGGFWQLVFPTFNDPTTGEPFDFENDPEGTWIGRMEFRDKDGALVTRCHSDVGEGWPGLITFDAYGNVTASLPSDVTEALTTVAGYGPGASRPMIYADLELIDPADDEVYKDFVGTGYIRQEVTTGD